MRSLFSLYSWRFPVALVYMLQSVEYRAWPYLKWFWRVVDFNTVMHRRSLVRTKAAKALLLAVIIGMTLQVATGIVLLAGWYQFDRIDWRIPLALIVSYPVVWAHAVVIPLIAGNLLIIKPSQHRAINRSRQIFAAHPGVKLAVVGSYGKTSMKEILVTVLKQGRKVAATPANKNVLASHAKFAARLAGDEDVLVIEYGEGQPGDVARLAQQTQPTDAVITGVAPAHLDRYKTLARAAEDIFSITDFVAAEQIYVNTESPDAKPYTSKAMNSYSSDGALGWKVSGVKVGLEGTSFTLSKKLSKKQQVEMTVGRRGRKPAKPIVTRKVNLTSGLLGRHQVGPLAFAAAFALEQGMAEAQVKKGIAATAAFEHRMQPYRLNGAWVIDDTYNGNLEGIRAGLVLLSELPARRKWYVTPGLVDQGRETARVHRQIGELIAGAKPANVVLIANSVTRHIEAGLRSGGFEGNLHIEHDPLYFYTNLQHFVAAGDLIMMQNDWTDNYA